MKTIGLIGGLGWESSASYYRLMNLEVRRRLGAWHSARIILDSLDFHPFATAHSAEDFEQLSSAIVASAQRLEQAGAELLVIACNTVHRFASTLQNSVHIPLLHIADPVGVALRREEHRKVGLLGTRATMEGAFYRKRLKDRFDIEVIVPGRNQRHMLHSLIVEELNGAETQSSRLETKAASAPASAAAEPVRQLDALIVQLAQQGASAVILGCTELGLAFDNHDKPIISRELPAFDTAVLHALAAVNASLDE